MNKPLILIVGQTATGKTDLSIDIAKRYGGEIVSIDSKQIYKDLDYCVGKINKANMQGVKHYMLDILDAGSVYDVKKFSEKAIKSIEEIYNNGKIPILVGGSGFYFDAVIYKGAISDIPADEEYRKTLNNMELSQLQNKLKKVDRELYNKIDIKNKVRIVRALEIIKINGEYKELQKEKRYDFVAIGLKCDNEILKERIKKRLDDRWSNMVIEIKNLLSKDVPYEWFYNFGLEVRHIAKFLVEKRDEEEIKVELEKEIFDYAKRQKTWFKRNEDIKWFEYNNFNKIFNYLDKTFN